MSLRWILALSSLLLPQLKADYGWIPPGNMLDGGGTSITASDGGPRAGYTGLLSQVRRKPIRHADSRTTTSILKFGA